MTFYKCYLPDFSKTDYVEQWWVATVRKFQRLLLIALYVSTTNSQGEVSDLWVAFIDMASGPQ